MDNGQSVPGEIRRKQEREPRAPVGTGFLGGWFFGLWIGWAITRCENKHIEGRGREWTWQATRETGARQTPDVWQRSGRIFNGRRAISHSQIELSLSNANRGDHIATGTLVRKNHVLRMAVTIVVYCKQSYTFSLSLRRLHYCQRVHQPHCGCNLRSASFVLGEPEDENDLREDVRLLALQHAVGNRLRGKPSLVFRASIDRSRPWTTAMLLRRVFLARPPLEMRVPTLRDLSLEFIPIISTFHWSIVCRGTPLAGHRSRSMSIPPLVSLRLRFLIRRTVPTTLSLNVQTFNLDQVDACLCLYRPMSSRAQTRLPCLGVVTSGVACLLVMRTEVLFPRM